MDHIDGGVTLTQRQFEFIRRFIRPIEYRKKTVFGAIGGLFKRTKSKNAEAKAYNDQVKRSYLTYDATLLELTAQIRELEARAQTAGQGNIAAQCEAERRAVSAIAARVMHAKSDEPPFDTAERELQIIGDRVEFLTALLDLEISGGEPEVAPADPRRPVREAIVEVARLASLDDSSALTPEMLRSPIDGDAETGRQRIAAALARLHTDMENALSGLLDRAPEMEEAEAAREARGILEARAADRQRLIDAAVTLLSGAAHAKLQGMADAANPLRPPVVAEREVARNAKIDAAVLGLTAAQQNIASRLTELAQQLDDETTSNNARRDIVSERSELQARQAELADRVAQLQAYQSAAGRRLVLIEKADETAEELAGLAQALELSGLRDQALAEFFEGNPPEPFAAANAALLVGGVTPEGDPAPGRIESLGKTFALSAKRVATEARLFLDEPEFFEISEDQHNTLKSLLATAQALADEQRYDVANALCSEAEKAWFVFMEGRNFSLPDVATSPPSEETRLRKDIAAVTVEMERFWARGGDPEGDHRDAVRGLPQMLDRAIADPPFDPSGLTTELKRLRAIAAGDIPPLPAAEQEARANAARTQSNIEAALLTLYRTERISAAETAMLDPDHVITVTGPDGNTQYHKILTKQQDTVDRREDKDIPREVMLRLRQKAEMLDVLKASEADGAGPAIEKIVGEAAELLNDIQSEGATYKKVTDKIAACESLLTKSEFATWRPSNLSDAKQAFDRFKSSWVDTMRPADALAEITRIETNLNAFKTRVGEMKAMHARLETMLDGIEAKLAKDGALSLALTAMRDAGAQQKLGPRTAGHLVEAEQEGYLAAYDKIAAGLASLADAGDAGEQVQGRLRERLADLKSKLATKAETAMMEVDRDAPTLGAEIEQQINALTRRPGTSLAAMETLARYIDSAAVGATNAKRNEEDMITKKADTERNLANIERALSENPNLASATEYKAIVDAIRKQLETTEATYRRDKDAGAARAAYDSTAARSASISEAISTTTQLGLNSGKLFDVASASTALNNNLAKVAAAAQKVATMIQTGADEQIAAWQEAWRNQPPPEDGDPPRPDDDPRVAALRTNVANATASLALITPARLSGYAAFPADMQQQIDDAAGQGSKAIQAVREKTLAAIRLIGARLDADPALKLYRDNPFDHGESWPQFSATLHVLETQIIKKLKG